MKPHRSEVPIILGARGIDPFLLPLVRFCRAIYRMRPEQAIPVWHQVVEAVTNHEISPEWVFRNMDRYTGES